MRLPYYLKVQDEKEPQIVETPVDRQKRLEAERREARERRMRRERGG